MSLPRFEWVAAAICVAVAPASGQADPVITDALIPEMERVFANTPGMIDHTTTVLGYAQDIHRRAGGDALVVQAAAVLHDIGIPEARAVHGSSAGQYQEIEGPPIAREILARHGFSTERIDHICGIVANHHSDSDPKIVNTIEFKILWDADWLVNFPRRFRDASAQEKAAAIERTFKTERGRALATAKFLD